MRPGLTFEEPDKGISLSKRMFSLGRTKRSYVIIPRYFSSSVRDLTVNAGIFKVDLSHRYWFVTGTAGIS